MVSLTSIFYLKVNSTNRVLLLKNTLHTVCQGLVGISCNAFFNCNILQGASIMELFEVCLVVSQTIGEGALVQMFSWYVREKWGS